VSGCERTIKRAKARIFAMMRLSSSNKLTVGRGKTLSLPAQGGVCAKPMIASCSVGKSVETAPL
jgi:hypothetical protein